jgi:tetratricopeptide (TPR) repeat protein
MVEAEHGNLRAALGWLDQTGDATTSLRLAGALWGFWYVRSHRSEGRRWLARALALGAKAPADVRAKALVGLGELEQSLGAVDRGAALLEEGLALRRKLKDNWGIAEALLLLGVAMQKQGEYHQATSLFEEADALFRQMGNEPWTAVARYHLGVLAYAGGDVPRAVALLTEALARNRAQGDLWGTAVSLGDLGLLASECGDHKQAAALFAESLGVWRTLGSEEGLVTYLGNVATLLAARGQTTEAARLFGASQALGEALAYSFELPMRTSYERAIAALRDRLGEVAFERAWTAGRDLALEQAIAEASELPASGVKSADARGGPRPSRGGRPDCPRIGGVASPCRWLQRPPDRGDAFHKLAHRSRARLPYSCQARRWLARGSGRVRPPPRTGQHLLIP